MIYHYDFKNINLKIFLNTIVRDPLEDQNAEAVSIWDPLPPKIFRRLLWMAPIRKNSENFLISVFSSGVENAWSSLN